MEDSCKVFVKKECVSSSNSLSHCGLPLNSLSPTQVQRERRYIRAEIIRCKRAGVACDDAILTKKRRLDEVSSVSTQNVPYPTLAAQVESDSNKTRQLRNRESAERSRLKKDLLVESLTYQVLQCVLQISDLKDEQNWLKYQQLIAMGCTASPYSTIDDCDNSSSSSSNSAVTTCDEAESDSDYDDCSSTYSSLSPSTAGCDGIMSPILSAKLHIVTPPPSTPTSNAPLSSSSSSYSSSCYYSEDELLDDCADLLDTWLLEGF